MDRTRRIAASLATALAIQWAGSVLAAEPPVKVEAVLTGLTNPCGVAIQPETDAVFISDTGAGQIVKLSTEASASGTPVVAGFPQAKDANSKEATYGVGPLGLVFLGQNMLIVGEGALKQGDEVVRIFELPSDGKPLDFNDTKQKLGPLSNPKSLAKGSGNFFGLALTPSALLVTAHGIDDKAWVLRSEIKNNSNFEELKPFIELKADTKIDALLGIAFNKHGFVVLGPRNIADRSGNASHRRQSQLAFYNGRNGNPQMSLPTELHDITGLAYSPKSGRLYAVDFAWDDPSQAGLYRLDAATVEGRPGVKAVKMTSLDKPSAMAFTSDNVLYVTAFGSIPKEPKTNKPSTPGKLLKITGDL